MAETITGAVEAFELDGLTSTWVDISADVNLAASALTVEYGIQSADPLARIAGPGTLTWVMNNSSSNSAGLEGYYSPGHTNARTGWQIGTLIRLSLTHTTPGTRYKFYGTLISITPDAGTFYRRGVACSAVDWLDEAARAKLRNVAVQEGQRADQIINTIVVNSVTRQPPATDYEVGRSTFVQALDNIDEERDTVLGALAKVVRSELGYLYMQGGASGMTLRFEDRHFRSLAATPTGSNIFDNTMVSLEAMQTRDTIINRANVVVHPRKTDEVANTVLYELTPTETVPSVEPSGGTLTIVGLLREAQGRFVRVGGKGLIAPQAGTDYVANSRADGLGTDRTSDVTVSVTAQSNSVRILLTNNHASETVYFPTLQVRGKAIQDTYESMVTVNDATSESDYGERVVRYDMPYESSTALGEAVAQWLVDNYKDPQFVVTMTLVGNVSATLADRVLMLEPGDKIAVRETVTGVTDTGSVYYFINGVRLEMVEGNIVTATYTLIRDVGQDAWILEEAGSQLGTNTDLGAL